VGGRLLGKGSYVLFFRLQEPLHNHLGEFSGLYCYVGSAFGPGGLDARLRRHLRRSKPLQWHIDLLTTSESFAPVSLHVTSMPLECQLAESLRPITDPHDGFGSSDCACSAHLFRVDPGSLGEIVGLLATMGLAEVNIEDLI
jgi:Uri superfamily endonuclease